MSERAQSPANRKTGAVHTTATPMANDLTPSQRTMSEAIPKTLIKSGEKQVSQVSGDSGKAPTALEVIEGLIDPQNDDKASVYMKGHLSKKLIDDTFLYEAKEVYPESTLRINCEEHNAPATFFSEAENKYKCLKCIVVKSELHYIDKRYKKQLEEFEAIKAFAMKAIVENGPNTSIIKEWKEAIRDTLIKVKSEFIEWIDNFTNKFVKSLNKIEQSRELINFVGEDKKQEMRLKDMQDKYKEILKIFYNIQSTKPNQKLVTIEGYRNEMVKIQQHLISKDKEIKKQATRVQKAMRETVDLDGLSIKIFGKYLKFLQQKVAARWEDPQPATQNDKNRQNAGEDTKNREENDAVNQLRQDNWELGAALNSDTPEGDKFGQNKIRGAQQIVQNARSATADPASSALNTSVITVSSRYRYENQNSIYYLKPNSNDIYFLDFKLKGFCREQVKWVKQRGQSLPLLGTSQQTTDANIYVIGGQRTSGGEPTVLKDCLQIDANLQVYEREQMRTARFGTPTCLIRDRFILALGGQTSRYNATKSCEAYDTVTNHWFPIASLPVTLVNTTAVVMNERFVYMMPGGNRDCAQGNSLLVMRLDTGSTASYMGDKASRTYGGIIATQKWQSLEFSQPDFVRAMPCAGIQLNQTDMLIFGGDSKTYFTSEMNDKGVAGQPKLNRGTLSTTGKFGMGSDFVARSFGNLVYMIDATNFNLHVFSSKDGSWNSQPLRELGIQA